MYPQFQNAVGTLFWAANCCLYIKVIICELVLSTKIDFYLFIMKLVCYFCDGGSETQHFQNPSHPPMPIKSLKL